MKNKLKMLSIIILFNIIISNFFVCVSGFSIDSANLQKESSTTGHLKYWNENLNDWFYIDTTIVKYLAPNGKKYPAYCVNRELHGVGTNYDNYTVNVTQAYSNNEVWRVIKNGYPYKSAETLEVENDEDAFVATKQAVYCILYNINPSTYYISQDDLEHGGSDEKGNKIKNAIVNLVNYARNNKETYSKGDFNIQKTQASEDNINEDYISSTYTLNSNFKIDNYSVSIQENFPKGTIITDINNIEKVNFNKYEKFKILVPKNSISNIWNNETSWSSSKINFNINVIANMETYPLLYGKTTIEGTQNYILTGNKFEQENKSTNFEYETKGGTIKVLKVSDDNNYWTNDKSGKALKGVKYELKRKDTNTILKIIETNENGEFNFSGLPKGEYILQEIESPQYYKRDEKAYNFKITNELEVINLKLTNSPIICGFFNVCKTSNSEKNKYLSGAKYEIKNSNGKTIYIGETTEDGKFKNDIKLEDGEYTIKEIESPEGYILDKNIYNFVIEKENGKQTIINLKNDAIEYKTESKTTINKTITGPKLPKTGF